MLVKNSSSQRTLTKGLVQFFTGDGGLKTSTALGTVMRASGYGLKVCVLFFLYGNRRLSEYKALTELDDINCEVFGRDSLLGPEDIGAADLKSGRKALETAERVVMNGDYDLVVLDEVSTAVAWNVIQLESILQLLRRKPANVELILTGRYDIPRLVDASDLVTKIVDGNPS